MLILAKVIPEQCPGAVLVNDSKMQSGSDLNGNELENHASIYVNID